MTDHIIPNPYRRPARTWGAPQRVQGCPSLDAVLEGASRVLDLGAVRVRETGRFLNLTPAEAAVRALRRDWRAAAARVLRGRKG